VRVLYVEDSRTDADLLRRELTKCAPHIELTVVETVAAAREQLAGAGPEHHVLLTDMRLPDGTGLELLREVRSRALPIAVVILTGSGQEETAVAALKAGADDYVVKSSRQPHLLPAVLETAWHRQRLESGRRMRPLRVLYGEHDAADIDLTQRHLAATAPHIRLEVVHDAAALRARLAGAEPRCDVLLLDLHLPGTTAFELIKELRHDRASDLPIVVVSGRGDEDVALQTLRIGGTDFVSKHAGYLHGLPATIEHAFDHVARERERRALLESQRRFADLVDSIDGIVWEADARTFAFTYVSHQAERLFGYPLEQWMQAGFWAAHIHPEDRARAVDYCLDCTRRGIAHEFEYRMLAADGRTIWLKDIVTVLLQDGQPVTLRGLMVDITALKATEAALRASEERLRLAIAAANVGLWDWDLASNRVVYSLEWKRQLGYGTDEIADDFREWETRVHPDDLSSTMQRVQQKVAGGDGAYEVEFRMRHRDGSWRWIYARGEVIRDTAGKPVRMLGCHVDITERRALEEQMRQAQKLEAVGLLAGGVAHDFNNLLTVIQGNAALLRAAPPASPQDAECVDQIAEAAERAAALTTQLLAFSRRQVLQPRLLDLNVAVPSIARLLRRLLPENVLLETHLHSEPLWLRADAALLDQVLVNLAVNARDAMPRGGKLTITTAPAPAHSGDATPRVVLHVTDTGTGISSDVLPHIFTPFFTTKEPGKGSGLGLATVFGIVKQHGGTIEPRTVLGRGTTFEIVLPATTAPEGTAPRAAGAAPRSRGGETVLVVEDEEPVRTLLQRLLARGGYTVLSARTGAEALTIVAEHPRVDLVLTDFAMPGQMTGKDLLAELRRRKPDLRAICMSGHAAEVIAEPGVFLPKPFTPDALLACVRARLDAEA
jgi:two-component system, cell cycle sensor histidine kinase and response regulator CckA